MPFFIRRESSDWSNELQKQDLIKTQFDLYYLFFLKGISKIDKNPKNTGTEDLKEITDNFPADYTGSKHTIVGLLVNTELKRLGIPTDDKGSVKKKYKQIVEPQSQAKLTSKGFTLMNEYASRGFELLKQELGNKPANLAPEFLINVVENLKKDFGKIF